MTTTAKRKADEIRTVTVTEAFIHERLHLEGRISAAAERIANANTEADRQKHKRMYDMLCEERNWL